MKNTFSGIKEEIDGGNYEISPINFIISPANFIISPINSPVDGSISHKPAEEKQLDIGRAELSLTTGSSGNYRKSLAPCVLRFGKIGNMKDHGARDMV